MNTARTRLAVLLTVLVMSALAWSLEPFTLGNVFKLGTSTGAALPASSATIQGGLIFDLDAGVPKFNDGVAWQTFSSPASSYFYDAGTAGYPAAVAGFITVNEPIMNSLDAGFPVRIGTNVNATAEALAIGSYIGGFSATPYLGLHRGVPFDATTLEGWIGLWTSTNQIIVGANTQVHLVTGSPTVPVEHMTIDATRINIPEASYPICWNGSSGGGWNACIQSVAGASLTATSTFIAPRYSFTAAQPTAFTNTINSALMADTNTGFMYMAPTTSKNQRTPLDLGGHPHPVMQQRMYIIDVGHNSTAAMTFDVAPRLTGGAITVTTVDVAAATAAAYSGNNVGYGTPLRIMHTTASANSTSTMTTSAAWIEARRAAPRWCERVTFGGTTSIRQWVGLADGLPGSSDNPTWNFEGFRLSSGASDTNIMYCVAAGGATTCTDTGVTPNNGTGTGWGTNLLCVDGREPNAVTFWVDGVAIARVTSGFPADGVVLKPIATVETLTTAAKFMALGRMSIEVN